MSHCHDEHEGHGHDHGHDHSHGAHDHTDDITPALQNHIYQQIDFSAINTLNEADPRSGAAICRKTWEERLNPEPELCSDADEQLLMHIPFTAQIRLHAIYVRTSPTSSAPQTLKVFVNRDDLDFSTAADLQPTQTFCLSQTSDVQEVPVKRALFNTVRSLDLFFEDNWSNGEEDETRISYIGFKGEWMQLSREPVNFLYEAAANPGDHKMVAGVRGEVGSRLGGAGGRDGM
ncbi:PITH domain-containing protein [Elsinoe fawcettii]|nr:PITH domain-containing protein [Elsinoe fawcettii]